MNTVYIDVLFLINFTVDYLALYLTGKTLRLPLHRWRLIVVSLVGALYALWAAMVPALRDSVIQRAMRKCSGHMVCLPPHERLAFRSKFLFIRRHLCNTRWQCITYVSRVITFSQRSHHAR